MIGKNADQDEPMTNEAGLISKSSNSQILNI
jgi:hypothetical protein